MRSTHIVLIVSMVRGLEEELILYINCLDGEHYMPCHVPDARSAFTSLASLLQGQKSKEESLRINRTSVVSAGGWSLCLGSLACEDPSDIGAELVLCRGVPTRGGEKRRYILDGVQQPKKTGLAARQREITINNFTVVAGPGEKCTLESWALSKKTRHFVGVTDDAFEVLQILNCEPLVVGKVGLQPHSLHVGFRSMQEASWQVIYTPPCEHSSATGQSTTLPEGVWTFHGFAAPQNVDLATEAVFAGLVAGESSARWILIEMMLHHWSSILLHSRTVCVRGRECCFDCSIHFAKNIQPGSRVGLVL